MVFGPFRIKRKGEKDFKARQKEVLVVAGPWRYACGALARSFLGRSSAETPCVEPAVDFKGLSLVVPGAGGGRRFRSQAG